jgi:3-oxoacyl-[acyl-carrier-protein] synthase III
VSDLYIGGPVTFQQSSGREVAIPFLLELVPDAVAELLRVEGIALGELTAVFLPEPAPGFRRRVAELLHLDPGRVIDPPEERVDRYTCSLPYLLHRARQARLVTDGDIGLLVEVGSGLSVACAVYRF